MRYRVKRLSTNITHYSAGNDPNRRFFFFHHAGGTGSAFHSWIDLLKEAGDLFFMELPGHAPRSNPVIPENWDQLMNLLLESIQEHINEDSYFIGHSMGALVAFELSRQLERKGALHRPRYLFLHAFKNPELFSRTKDYTDLTVEKLVKTMVRLGGTPKAILQDSSIMALLLKNMKLDFELLQTYSLEDGDSKVDIPIKVYGSTEDSSIPASALPGWQNFTTKRFDCEVMSGDHFFLHQQQSYLFNDYLSLIGWRGAAL